MFVSMALLISMALATPPTVEEATRLHLAGASVEAVELLLPEIDQDPAAALALGRVFFANSQWALAEAAYHRVPRDSPLWFRSRLEATWAVYYLDPTHERAIARALLLYAEDPTDWELRYLIGVLMLHCSERSTGVQDLTEALLRDLDGSPEDWAKAAEILLLEITPEPKMDYEYASRPEECTFFVARHGDVNMVQRAVILTLAGKQGGFTRFSFRCSLHAADCPDPREHRTLNREARRWLRSYRDDLD